MFPFLLSKVGLTVTYTSCRYYTLFNVTALLLDDALKPATPLTNGAINENHLIFDEVKAYKNYAKFLGHPDVTFLGLNLSSMQPQTW